MKNEISINILFAILVLQSCLGADKKEPTQLLETNEIVCTNSACFGTYMGAEFINGSDVAHQFSNKMANGQLY